MPTTDYLSIARTAMSAFRLGMSVAGYNVANSQTAGFSRRTISLTSQMDNPVRGGYLGTGVDVVSVTRVRDGFTDYAFRNETSRLAGDQSRNSVLAAFEPTLGTAGKPVLTNSLSNFFDSLETLVSQPDNTAVRADVMAKAGDLASTFNRLDAAIVNAQRDTDSRVASAANRVNQIVDVLKQMNVDLVQQETGTGEASTLRDQRDQLIDELSSIVPINIVEQSNGQLNVYLQGTGDTLLSAVNAHHLTIAVDANGFNQVAVDRGGQLVNLSGKLAGGSLGGYLTARDTDFANYRATLDTLATNVMNQFNAVQKAGYDQLGNPGQSLFQPDPPGTNAAASMGVNPLIAADPRLLAASSAANESGNNTNARAFIALREKTLTTLGGQTLSQFGAGLISQVGQDVKTSNAAIEASQLIVDSLDQKRAQTSGVSLDEEAANLVKWQQAFSASARFLQMANSVIDDTLAALSK